MRKKLSQLKAQPATQKKLANKGRTVLLFDIRRLRVEKGITLREAGAASGVSYPTLMRVELGADPDLRTAILLSEFYEMSISQLWAVRR